MHSYKPGTETQVLILQPAILSLIQGDSRGNSTAVMPWERKNHISYQSEFATEGEVTLKPK